MKKIKIQDSNQDFVVGNIFCVGRNYSEHAKEMHTDIPDQPMIFLKPSSAIISNGENIIRPNISKLLHHEVELVVAIGISGKNIPCADAYNHVLGYGVGLDMTLRDIQNDAKKQGSPWTLAKGFVTSAPISEIIPSTMISNPHNLIISCKVNGIQRQKASTCDMIFKIDKLIEYISALFTLEAGDLIFTGTPVGVGEAKPGDTIEAELIGYTKIFHQIFAA
jgi:acylpyruvate hydrolase